MKNETRIEKMTMEQYDEMYALWMSSKGMGLNDIDDSREGIERFLKRNPNTCFAAFQERRLVGVILAGNDGRRGYIYHTAVREECQRQGIGSSLVQTVLDALEKEGIHKAALVVFARNVSGNEFWERHGFIERTDIVYRNRALAEFVRIDT